MRIIQKNQNNTEYFNKDKFEYNKLYACKCDNSIYVLVQGYNKWKQGIEQVIVNLSQNYAMLFSDLSPLKLFKEVDGYLEYEG